MKKILFISIIVCFITIQFNFAQEATHVKTIGEGQPLLLLPGFANSSEVWEQTLEQLDGQHKIHLIDYAGFNGLAPVETPWLPKVKAALKDYVLKNKLSDITIIGHSLGGTLALYLAGELPEKVKQIIVVDALPNTAKLMFPNQASGSFSYDNPYAKSQLNMKEGSFKQMLSGQLQMMCKNTDKHEQILNWMLKTDRKTYVYGYIDYLNFDATPFLEKIKANVLILAATSYGRTQSEMVYKDQFSNLEHYDIKFADDAAHYIMYDQPDWFYQQVNQALNNE